MGRRGGRNREPAPTILGDEQMMKMFNGSTKDFIWNQFWHRFSSNKYKIWSTYGQRYL